MSFPKFVNMTKNTPFFPILHVFAPLKDVPACTLPGSEKQPNYVIFIRNDIQLQIQVAPRGWKKQRQNKQEQNEGVLSMVLVGMCCWQFESGPIHIRPTNFPRKSGPIHISHQGGTHFWGECAHGFSQVGSTEWIFWSLE